MAKIKSIPTDKAEVIIEDLKLSLQLIKDEVANPTGNPNNNLVRAVGYAEKTIQKTIRQLKGDFY